jgi:hypothetical protein
MDLIGDGPSERTGLRAGTKTPKLSLPSLWMAGLSEGGGDLVVRLTTKVGTFDDNPDLPGKLQVGGR